MLTRYDYFGSRFAWTKLAGRLRPQLARLDATRREARRGTVSLTRSSRRKRERREKVASVAGDRHAAKLADLAATEPPVGLTHCILWVGSSPAEAKARSPRGTQVFGSAWLWRKACEANPAATRSVYVDLSRSWDGEGTDFLGVWNCVRVVTEGEYGEPDARYFEVDESHSRTYLAAWQSPVRGGERMHALCLDRLNFILARLVSEGTRVLVKDWCPAVWPTEPRYRKGLPEYTRPDARSQCLRGTWEKAGGEWYAFVEHRYEDLGEMTFPVNGTCRYFSEAEARAHGLEMAGPYPVTVDVYGLKMREVRLDYHQHVAGYAYGPSGQMIRQWLAESGINWAEPDAGEDAEESCSIEKAPRMWCDLSAYLRSDHGGGQLHPDQAAEVVGTYERGDEVLVVHGKGWQGDREDDAEDGNDFVSSIVAWQDTVDDLTRPSALYRVMHHRSIAPATAVSDDGYEEDYEHCEDCECRGCRTRRTLDVVPLSSEVHFHTLPTVTWYDWDGEDWADGRQVDRCTEAAWRLWATIDDQVTALLDRVTLPALKRDAQALAKLVTEAVQVYQAARQAYGDSAATMALLPAAAREALRDAWASLDARIDEARGLCEDDRQPEAMKPTAKKYRDHGLALLKLTANPPRRSKGKAVREAARMQQLRFERLYAGRTWGQPLTK